MKNSSEFSPDRLSKPSPPSIQSSPSLPIRTSARGAAEDEVVAFAGEHLGGVGAGHEEVLAVVAEQQVEAVAVADDVVAGVAAQEVVAERILDDVVAVAAEHLVGLHRRR